MLAPLVDDLAITTNGYLLERDAAALVDAGVGRFNVSIDSLQRDRFFQMTRRDALPRVLAGLDALAAFADRVTIKVNAVAIRGFTEQEAIPFAEFAREQPLRGALHRVHAARRRPRLGPVAGAHRRRDPRGDPRSLSARRGAARAERDRERLAVRRRQGHDRLRQPRHEPFCGDCNRIRLTADGRLRTCLFSLNETDMREPLRSGASDDDLEEIVRAAVWRKELKHRVNEPGFIQPARPMSAIGG